MVMCEVLYALWQVETSTLSLLVYLDFGYTNLFTFKIYVNVK